MESIEDELDQLLDEVVSTGKTFNLNDYTEGSLIYLGNLSEIKIVENKKTKGKYAMKSYQKNKIHQLYKDMEIINEKITNEKIQNYSNIISYYGTAKNKFKIYFLYEYIEGKNLQTILSNYGLKSEKLVKFYFIQILKSIKYLHSLNIPHRDIKPDNIILSKDEKQIKIIDFGSSCDLNNDKYEKMYEEILRKEKGQKKIYKYFIGTPGFIAPECIHNKFADKRSDYWSLGCLLYNLFTGFPPFLGENTFDALEKASDGNFIFPNGIISNDAIDLINKTIVVDTDKRLNIDQMLSHPFLSKEYGDKKFLNNIPCITKDEEEFYNNRINLDKKYEKVKKISDDLNLIKENKNLDEELKRNDEEMLNLMKNENNLQKEYDDYLKNVINYIYKSMKDDIDENKIHNSKLKFLQTQTKDNLFNIKYYGYVVQENKESESSSSNSSNEEDNENK